jgi:AcrR family transcriptional regulator
MCTDKCKGSVRMKIREGSVDAIPKARCNGSREAIAAAAREALLERNFGAVSMDDLGG